MPIQNKINAETIRYNAEFEGELKNRYANDLTGIKWWIGCLVFITAVNVILTLGVLLILTNGLK